MLCEHNFCFVPQHILLSVPDSHPTQLSSVLPQRYTVKIHTFKNLGLVSVPHIMAKEDSPAHGIGSPLITNRSTNTSTHIHTGLFHTCQLQQRAYLSKHCNLEYSYRHRCFSSLKSFIKHIRNIFFLTEISVWYHSLKDKVFLDQS